MAEDPAHRLLLADMTINHDLRGAPRAIPGGEIDALLDLHRFAVGGEGPYIAVGQQQNNPMAVAQAVCLDGWMQMKADGELVRLDFGDRSSGGGRKAILALECPAIGRESDDTVVDDAEWAGVTVVRSAQAGVFLRALNVNMTGAADDGNAKKQSAQPA